MGIIVFSALLTVTAQTRESTAVHNILLRYNEDMQVESCSIPGTFADADFCVEEKQ